MKNRIATLAFVSLGLATPFAGAHVVLEQKSATVSSYYKATFMVGHGCNGSPTREIRISIPQGVINVKPMPKSGWSLQTRIEPLPRAYELHGKQITEGVAEVTWGGGALADVNYDEFVMLMRLPAEPGTLYFKILQTCEQGENRWEEIPSAGKTTRDYKTPAAALEVTPSDEHKHH